MIKFKTKEEQLISQEDISNLEKDFSIKFPDDYKIFMQKYNGCFSIPESYFRPDLWDDEVEFHYLHPIKYGKTNFESFNLDDGLEEYPENQLDIGKTGTGYLSMSFKEEEHGSIYVFYSDGEMHKLTDSFTQFIEGLQEYQQ